MRQTQIEERNYFIFCPVACFLRDYDSPQLNTCVELKIKFSSIKMIKLAGQIRNLKFLEWLFISWRCLFDIFFFPSDNNNIEFWKIHQEIYLKGTLISYFCYSLFIFFIKRWLNEISHHSWFVIWIFLINDLDDGSFFEGVTRLTKFYLENTKSIKILKD